MLFILVVSLLAIGATAENKVNQSDIDLLKEARQQVKDGFDTCCSITKDQLNPTGETSKDAKVEKAFGHVKRVIEICTQLSQRADAYKKATKEGSNARKCVEMSKKHLDHCRGFLDNMKPVGDKGGKASWRAVCQAECTNDKLPAKQAKEQASHRQQLLTDIDQCLDNEDNYKQDKPCKEKSQATSAEGQTLGKATDLTGGAGKLA